jgi:hypothetical protein
MIKITALLLLVTFTMQSFSRRNHVEMSHTKLN